MRFKHSDYAKGADAEVLLKATIVVCCHYLSCNYIQHLAANPFFCGVAFAGLTD